MVSSSVLAKRYARAFFLATTQEVFQQHIDDFRKIHQLANAHPPLWKTLGSPCLPPQQQQFFFRHVGQSLNLHQLTQNFLQVLVGCQRLCLLFLVEKEFCALVDTHHNIQEGQLETAFSLPKQTIEDFAIFLQETTGELFRITHHVKPCLVGGAVFSWKCFMADGSLSSQLRHLKKALYDQAFSSH